MKALIIDYQDSFTYNIQHILAAYDIDVTVIDDEQLDLGKVEQYDFIVLSPGPGIPSEKKSLFSVLESYSKQKPILGVCLGMQGIVEFYGGRIYNLDKVNHGVTTTVEILKDDLIFKECPRKLEVGLYHSWACDTANSPLEILMRSEDGVTMAVKHPDLPVYGVQFHPESVLTPYGRKILENFINLVN